MGPSYPLFNFRVFSLTIDRALSSVGETQLVTCSVPKDSVSQNLRIPWARIAKETVADILWIRVEVTAVTFPIIHRITHPSRVREAIGSSPSPTLDSSTASKWAWSITIRISTFPPLSTTGKSRMWLHHFSSSPKSVTGVGLATFFIVLPSSKTISPLSVRT